MTTSMLARCAAAALLLSACGGDDGDASDAGPGTDGAAPIDAVTTDASIVDCAADHQERGDGQNDPITGDGAAEATELLLSASGEPFTVCGQIDPAHSVGSIADGDAFAFELTGNNPSSIRIEMVAPGGADLDGLALRLYEAGEGPPVERAKGVFRNGYALVAGLSLEPGLYWLGVTAGLPLPDAPVGYTITVSRNEYTCAADGGAPDFTEAGDGAGRGNDMVTILYPAPPAATASGADDAEATGETLAAGEVVHLRGISAALASDGDSYLDRDTFLIATGADTTELEVRLTWPDPIGEDAADLDLYLFAAGALDEEFSGRLGAVAGDQDDETFTINVDPSRSYWLWVGAFDDTDSGGGGALPETYDVTLCAREHE